MVRVLLIVGALCLAAGMVACGDDDDDTGDAPEATSTVAASPTFRPPSNTAQVVVKDFEFSPKTVEVQKNAEVTITVKNEGNVAHTFTVYDGSDFTVPIPGSDSGLIAPGTTGTVKVSLPGNAIWAFRCEVHPTQMEGELSPK